MSYLCYCLSGTVNGSGHIVGAQRKTCWTNDMLIWKLYTFWSSSSYPA